MSSSNLTSPNYPSKNPADEGSLAGTLNTAMRKLLQKLDGQLPAKILSYNRTTNRATVQPMIDLISTAGDNLMRAQIVSVPVLAIGGGGYCINWPLGNGDSGWIEASDRDISLWMQSLAEAVPNTFRMHSFEDSRFIPDVFYKYTFDEEDDAGNMVIQKLDGTVKITLGPNTINVEASAVINLTAPTINIAASTEITLTSPSIISSP